MKTLADTHRFTGFLGALVGLGMATTGCPAPLDFTGAAFACATNTDCAPDRVCHPVDGILNWSNGWPATLPGAKTSC